MNGPFCYSESGTAHTALPNHLEFHLPIRHAPRQGNRIPACHRPGKRGKWLARLSTRFFGNSEAAAGERKCSAPGKTSPDLKPPKMGGKTPESTVRCRAGSVRVAKWTDDPGNPERRGTTRNDRTHHKGESKQCTYKHVPHSVELSTLAQSQSLQQRTRGQVLLLSGSGTEAGPPGAMGITSPSGVTPRIWKANLRRLLGAIKDTASRKWDRSGVSREGAKPRAAGESLGGGSGGSGSSATRGRPRRGVGALLAEGERSAPRASRAPRSAFARGRRREPLTDLRVRTPRPLRPRSGAPGGTRAARQAPLRPPGLCDPRPRSRPRECGAQRAASCRSARAGGGRSWSETPAAQAAAPRISLRPCGPRNQWLRAGPTPRRPPAAALAGAWLRDSSPAPAREELEPALENPGGRGGVRAGSPIWGRQVWCP